MIKAGRGKRRGTKAARTVRMGRAVNATKPVDFMAWLADGRLPPEDELALLRKVVTYALESGRLHIEDVLLATLGGA